MPAIGALVGWHLDFREGAEELSPRVTSFGSSDYVASIDAALPAGLDGGAYTFVVEGVTNDDYKQLYKTMASGTLVVRLHLYWRDGGGVKGYFVDLAGLSDSLGGDEPPTGTLVAVLRVLSLTRRPGSRRYEVVIEAREWVFDRLLGRLATEGTETDPLLASARIAADRNIDVSMNVLGSVSSEGGPELDRSWQRRLVALDELRRLDRAMESATKKHGLGMFLIRDNSLVAGPGRLAWGDLHELTDDTGLVEISARGHELTDPYFVPVTDLDVEPRRAVYELVLRGRPDIKTGDFVDFVRPAEETDASGIPNRFSLDLLDETKPGDTIRLYVRGVTHALGRERAFVTTLRGVAVPIDDDPDSMRDSAWFSWSPANGATPAVTEVHDDSPEGEFVGALREVVDRAGGRRLDVAQVRATNVAAGGKLVPQTEKLWRGLVEYDGRRYGATVLPFDAESKATFDDAPYVSPFAWGAFGLVLPRYPGMRVVVGHRQGDPDDILDLGATWQRGDAPASRPGDYWLGLPAAIAPTDREKLEDTKAPTRPSGKATNDLIDADGNRVIEVGKLTVRVGTNLLTAGGTRPVVATEHVHIEHQSGAAILIDQDGNITIKAAGKLDLVAGGEITFDTPANVVVKTGGFMDVKGRT